MSYRTLMRFHWKDYRREIIILLSVLVLVNIALVVLKLFLPSLDTGKVDSIFGISRVIIVIFTVISMIVTATMTFPLMSGFSVTRRDFYLSTLLAAAAFCLTAALAEGLLFELSQAVLPRLGLELNSGRPFVLHWYELTTSLMGVSLTALLITSCFCRFGVVGGTLSVVVYCGLMFVISELLLSLPSLDFMKEQDIVPLAPNNLYLGNAAVSWVNIILLIPTGWLLYRRAPVRM